MPLIPDQDRLFEKLVLTPTELAMTGLVSRLVSGGTLPYAGDEFHYLDTTLLLTSYFNESLAECRRRGSPEPFRRFALFLEIRIEQLRDRIGKLENDGVIKRVVDFLDKLLLSGHSWVAMQCYTPKAAHSPRPPRP